MNSTHDTGRDGHPDELLSLYVDGELGRAQRRRVDDHLERCEECREVVEDLEEVVARMDELPGREPPRNYWPRIAETIGTDGRAQSDVTSDAYGAPVLPLFRQRRRVSVGRLAAAAALVAALASGVTWGLVQWESGGSGAGSGVASSDVPAASSGGSGSAVQFAALGGGTESVERLETEYREARDELDPATRRMLDRNLELIDRALEQARQELAEHPTNAYVQQHLTQVLTRKARYLATAVELADRS